jgi:hypothetical protein
MAFREPLWRHADVVVIFDQAEAGRGVKNSYVLSVVAKTRNHDREIRPRSARTPGLTGSIRSISDQLRRFKPCILFAALAHCRL